MTVDIGGIQSKRLTESFDKLTQNSHCKAHVQESSGCGSQEKEESAQNQSIPDSQLCDYEIAGDSDDYC